MNFLSKIKNWFFKLWIVIKTILLKSKLDNQLFAKYVDSFFAPFIQTKLEKIMHLTKTTQAKHAIDIANSICKLLKSFKFAEDTILKVSEYIIKQIKQNKKLEPKAITIKITKYIKDIYNANL